MTSAVGVSSSPVGRSSSNSVPFAPGPRRRASPCASWLPPSGKVRFREPPPSAGGAGSSKSS
eukprot:754081-Pleurochrysis_carterae.AAC.1